MPELPEVETVKRGLDQLIVGKKITNVIFDWAKSFPNTREDIDQFLIGAKILKLRRRGKALIINLDTNYSLVIHLKMTGQLVFVGDERKPEVRNVKQHETRNKLKTSAQQSSYGFKSQASNFEIVKPNEVRFGAGHPSKSLISELPDKSTRVTLTFSDGTHLYFNDQRKFGWMRLLPTIEVANLDFLKKMGPEPLAAGFTNKKFIQQLKRRNNSGMKAVLLDQTVIAGVGNIYADESLYAAKIHPESLVKNISEKRLTTLFYELQNILQFAIKKGGSTDKNYVNAKGKRGSYLTFAKVFRLEGEACERCGSIIIKTRVAGRGTHICATCQSKSVS